MSTTDLIIDLIKQLFQRVAWSFIGMSPPSCLTNLSKKHGYRKRGVRKRVNANKMCGFFLSFNLSIILNQCSPENREHCCLTSLSSKIVLFKI